MLPDYEIKRTTTMIEKIMPYIEFILILIILQTSISLFTSGPSEEGEAIQFRVLAHSNTTSDQEIKAEIQREIEPFIEKAVATSQTVEELGKNLAEIEGEILDIANSISKDVPVTLKRTDALFPPKRSGFIVQPQATYDAYILTIGSGRGDNWWCSLFPKVCFPDEKENSDEKVTFFIWEWIKGLFS